MIRSTSRVLRRPVVRSVFHPRSINPSFTNHRLTGSSLGVLNSRPLISTSESSLANSYNHRYISSDSKSGFKAQDKDINDQKQEKSEFEKAKEKYEIEKLEFKRLGHVALTIGGLTIGTFTIVKIFSLR